MYSSFFNHDCLSNSNRFTIGDYHFVFCIREIDKGEEITTKYISSTKSYKERQQLLVENWRFNCNCQLCQYQVKKNDETYNNLISNYSTKEDEVHKHDLVAYKNWSYSLFEKFSYIRTDVKTHHHPISLEFLNENIPKRFEKCKERNSEHFKNEKSFSNLKNLSILSISYFL